MQAFWLRIRENPFLYLYLLVAGLLVFTVMRNAWLSDDVLITFRYLYNWLHGYGLVWNTPERVQAFTHPAWLFAMAPGYALSGAAYLTVLITSLACLLLSLRQIWRIAAQPGQAVALVLILLSSRSWVDFSSSGLENPLSHLLILLFIGTWLRKDSAFRAFKLSLIASLLLLNRLDFALLLAPALLQVLGQDFSWRTLKQMLLGGLPLLFWELFSLIYYGFFLPNTYYAKAATALPRSWLLEQGLAYYADILQADFIVLPVLGLLVLLVLRRRLTGKGALGLGLVLYLLYILWIGGDFMSGRFFTVPFLWALALLASKSWTPPWTWALAGLLFLGGLVHPYAPLKIHKDYYADRRGNERALYGDGIVDEKGMAWARSGFLLHGWKGEVAQVETAMASWGEMPEEIVLVEQQVAVGMRGYERGPVVFIVDELALTDPLLARLPALRVPYWRIGHFFRRIPAGYLESVGKDQNLLEDPDLKTYYRRLRRVTEGDIWSGERWNEIWRFMSGQNQGLIDQDGYATPTEAEIHRFD